jgi:membrane protein required for colicin V production
MNLSVTFVDFLVVLVIIVSAGYAAWRGFVSETLSIFAWAAAAFATLYFGPWITPLVKSLIATAWLALVVGYAVIFLAVFIPLSFMSYRFAESVKHSPIGPLDRALGLAFGVVRGLVIVGLAYLAFTFFVPVRNQPRWLAQARLLPMIQSSSEVLLSLVPNRDINHHTARRRPDDPLADVIRRTENVRPNRHSRPVVTKKHSAAYGTKDREALDRLIEATGSDKP